MMMIGVPPHDISGANCNVYRPAVVITSYALYLYCRVTPHAGPYSSQAAFAETMLLMAGHVRLASNQQRCSKIQYNPQALGITT